MTKRGWLAVMATLWLTSALAGAEPASVIQAGREAEVLALFAPHQLGREVIAGYRLWNVRIEPEKISVELRGPNATTATFDLVRGQTGEHTQSFSVRRGPATTTGDAARAADALVEAARRNDHGGFWRPLPPTPRSASAPPSGPPVSWPVALAVPALLAALCALAMWSATRRFTSPREPARGARSRGSATPGS